MATKKPDPKINKIVDPYKKPTTTTTKKPVVVPIAVFQPRPIPAQKTPAPKVAPTTTTTSPTAKTASGKPFFVPATPTPTAPKKPDARPGVSSPASLGLPASKPAKPPVWAQVKEITKRAAVEATRQPKNKPLTSAPKPTAAQSRIPASPGGLKGNAAGKLAKPAAANGIPAAANGIPAATMPSAASPAVQMTPSQREFGSAPQGTTAASGAASEASVLFGNDYPAPAPQSPPNVVPSTPAGSPQVNGGGYRPQTPSPTGLGDEYDAVYGAEVERENARGAAFDAAHDELDMPNKRDYTDAWDDQDQRFQDEYDKRYGRMKSQWDEQKAALQAEYQGKLAQINAAQSAGQAGVAAAIGGAKTDYGPAPTAQPGALDGSRYLGGLGDAGRQQQAAIADPGAPQNWATSSITPEVLAAMQREYNQQISSQSASSRSSAGSAYNEALQDAYRYQGQNENDLLDIYGKNTTANTSGRTKSIDDYYGANRGAVETRGKLLKDQYEKSAANERAMTDIAADRRNVRDNAQRESTSIRSAETSRANNEANNVARVEIANQADGTRRAIAVMTDGTRRDLASMSDETKRALGLLSAETSLTNQRERTAAGVGTSGSTTKPKLLKGDEYIATKLGKSPKTAALVRTITSNIQNARSQKKLPDGTDNLLWGTPQDELLKQYWARHPDQAKTLKKHVEGYLNGEMYAAPKGNAASGGGGVKAARAGFTAAKAAGYRVDGLGAVSAQHHATNPNSDHETGKAFDLHAKGPEALKYAMSIPGSRYLIHDRTEYDKVNGKWVARPYGGTFKNGKKKDPHTNHIHVNF